jgi:hypothetical protein
MNAMSYSFGLDGPEKDARNFGKIKINSSLEVLESFSFMLVFCLYSFIRLKVDALSFN